MEPECGPKCCSKKHADNVFSVITKAGEGYEDNVMNFLVASCHNSAINKDSSGRTALHIAASYGRIKILQWLLSIKEAHVHTKDTESGYTPLHRAFFYGQLHAARCLLNHHASLFQTDHDYFTVMDHLIQDGLISHSSESNQLHEVSVWGSNNNYSLGIGNQQARSDPEVLDCFRKDKTSVKQVVMSKFHSVFIAHSGQVFSCGHGQGGRLGHASEHPVLIPKKISLFDSQVCKMAAVGMDHTVFLTEEGQVWTCGMNQYHQLGHSSSVVKELMPKCISTFSGKNKAVVIHGVCASRYHSVFWSPDSLFTCGLNAGALGHIKGDRTVITPKEVTTFSAKDVIITHVAASEGATAVATKKGDVYVLHEYQCRKIASKQFELEKIVMIGGQLDTSVLDEKQSGKAIKLQVILLTNSGKLYLWSESNPVLTRCFFRIGRPLIIKDIALSNSSMALVSREGEVFNGTLIPKDTKKMDAQQSVQRTSSWIEFAKREQSYQIRVQRVPFIYHAESIACDPEGKNFTAIQNPPSTQLMDQVQIVPPHLLEDMKQLLEETNPEDPVHDVIFVVGSRSFAAHRFVIASAGTGFYKELGVGVKERVQIDTTPSEVFQLILEFIYTGACSFPSSETFGWTSPTLEPDHHRPKRKEDVVSNDNFDFSKSPSYNVRVLSNHAKQLGVHSLVSLLEKVRVSNSVPPKRIATSSKQFSRGFATELCDVTICSEDGKEFGAHRVILAARLDYFRSMFNCGWIETTKRDVLSLPVHSSVLDVVLDYIYKDKASKIDKSDDIGWIGNCLVVADQLLIPRLVSICEARLVRLLNLKNAGQMLEFSSTYNAEQLKRACMHFMCVNLPAVVEMRIWDCVSEEVMDELTAYYREIHPRMAYRFLGPHSEAPSDEILGQYAGLNKVTLLDAAAFREHQKAKRSKVRRKSGREHGEGTKERQISVCSVQSIDSIDDESPLSALSVIKPPKIEWSKVERPKRSARKSTSETESVPTEALTALSVTSPVKKDEGRNQFPHPVVEPKPPELVSPAKPSPTLFDLAVISKTASSSTSPSSKSKKFPKLSQKQRRMQGSSSPIRDCAAQISSSKSLSENSPIGSQSSESRSGGSCTEGGKRSPWSRPDKTTNSADSASFPELGRPDAGLIPPAPKSMRSIIATEEIQHRNSAKSRSKPLKLTLIEDQAIADLNEFYQTDVVDDEYITVERVVPSEFASPIWTIPRTPPKLHLF